MEKFDLVKRDKRIVLEHKTGRLKGIHAIAGLESEAPSPLPEYMPDSGEAHGHVPVSLVAVKNSHILYREVMAPEMTTTFNRSQR